MDRVLILICLQAAEKHIATSEQLIVNQCRLIRILKRAGEDTTRAIALFREMERRQLEHLADRDQLLTELGVAEAVELQKQALLRSGRSAIRRFA